MVSAIGSSRIGTYDFFHPSDSRAVLSNSHGGRGTWARSFPKKRFIHLLRAGHSIVSCSSTRTQPSPLRSISFGFPRQVLFSHVTRFSSATSSSSFSCHRRRRCSSREEAGAAGEDNENDSDNDGSQALVAGNPSPGTGEPPLTHESPPV